MSKKIILVDTSALIYSAFYSFGVLSHNGQPTGVIYGVFKKILTVCEKLKSNRVLWCHDHPINGRKQIFTPYKEGRRKDLSPEEVEHHSMREMQQGILRKEALPKFGFRNHFRQSGYEADDFLAILSERYKDQKVVIVTADADMYQCLDHCDILNPSTMKMMTKKKFIEKFKCQPSQWAICKAIGGCEGDNVIGIVGASDPKSGTSKAVKYVTGDLKSGVIYERIKSDKGKEIIRRNLPLVQLPFQPEGVQPFLVRRNKFTKKRMIKVFSKYNFNSLLKDDIFNRYQKIFLEW
jgi:5'-3' exonuclease